MIANQIAVTIVGFGVALLAALACGFLCLRFIAKDTAQHRRIIAIGTLVLAAVLCIAWGQIRGR